MIVRSVTIGTADTCDLVVVDEYASTRHCRIDQHDSGRYTVTDLASTNGTWLRRQWMLSPVRVPAGTGFDLTVGDVLRVGRTEIPWRNEEA